MAADAHEFEEILAQRLHQHEEKMKVHRQLVQEQRQWLMQSVVGSSQSSPTRRASAAAASTEVQPASAAENPGVPSVTATTDRRPSSPRPEKRLAPGASERDAQVNNTEAHEGSTSRQRSGASPAAVVDRLLSQGQQAAQRLAESRLAAQEKKLQEEQRAMQPAELPRRAVTPSSSLQREIRSQMKKKQILETEFAEVTGTPHISAQSAHLAAKRRALEQRDGIDIGESLLIRDQQSKAEKWLRIQYYASQEVPAKPDITAKASRLVSDRPAADRLYDDAIQRKAEQTLLQNELRTLVDESLELTHQPVITPRAQQLRRKEGHTASIDLYDQAVKLRAAKETERELVAHHEKEMAKKKAPRIDPVSDMIAGRLPESATERLIKPKGKKVLTEGPSSELGRHKSEAKRRAASASSSQRLLELHAESYRRKAKKLELAQTAELKEVEGCTFQPVIKKVDRYLAHETVHKDVSERALHWAQRREQRIQELAEDKSIREKENCTFTPTVNSKKPEHNVLNGNSGGLQLYGGDGKAWGYHEYLERQHAARQMKLDQTAREAAVFSHGTHWTGKVTLPSPPRLSSTSPVHSSQIFAQRSPVSLAAPSKHLLADSPRLHIADQLRPISSLPRNAEQSGLNAQSFAVQTAPSQTQQIVGTSSALQRAMEALQKAQRVSSLIADR